MGCVNSRDTSSSGAKGGTGDAIVNGAASDPKDKKSAGVAGANMKGGNFSGPVVNGGPLTQKEYNSRIVSSMTVQSVQMPKDKYEIQYAYVSQRGYYPESLDKANQDSFCVHTSFGGDPNCQFFGVFDGHGEHGTACSIFTRDRVSISDIDVCEIDILSVSVLVTYAFFPSLNKMCKTPVREPVIRVQHRSLT